MCADGEISASEIKNSAAALRRLDKNGDGSLTAVEVIPDQAANQAAMILSRLDKNGDGKISQDERATDEGEQLRELLDDADRNQDGVVTREELTNEMRLRAERKRQLQNAIRSK